MCSVYDDEELYDWLRWAEENGTSFLRTISEAALLADLKHYSLLRPVLLKLKKMYPENSWVLPLDARVGRAKHDTDLA